MTLPAAGWFPDPQDANRLRWWDGHAWGTATHAMPTRTGPVVPVVVAPVGPSFSVQGGALRTGSWASGSAAPRIGLTAFVAVVLAVVSVAWNPFGAVSVVAIILGVVGVVRPGASGARRVVARSAAASALVVAVATAAVAVAAQLAS
ncbi:DUF2510 domain-containing protein [Curtobacterium albidum]|uniref:DUF2510 domain-containing protein n=1 Tax=Curtobacterium citreum TaxID=2036 RepID=A0A850DQP1_9MICO|nr:DUF2510 domain-containing protein [Curtobacterium albidum]